MTRPEPLDQRAGHRSSALRHAWTAVRVALAALLLWWLGRSGLLDWSALLGLVRAWPLALAGLALIVVDLVATGMRFAVLLRPHGLRLTLGAAFRLTAIGLFFGFFLPGSTGSDVSRMYYVSAGNRGRRVELATVILLDRVAGLIALLLVPLSSAPFFPELVASSSVIRVLLAAAGAGVTALLAGLVVGTSDTVRFSRPVTWLLGWIPLGKHLARVLDTVRAYRNDRRALLVAIGCSLVAHGLAIAAALLVALAVNPGGFDWAMVVLLPLGFMANSVPGLPGGVGQGEAAVGKLFEAAGLTDGAAVMLGFRLLVILTSLLGLLFYLRGQGRLVHAVGGPGGRAADDGDAGAVRREAASRAGRPLTAAR